MADQLLAEILLRRIIPTAVWDFDASEPEQSTKNKGPGEVASFLLLDNGCLSTSEITGTGIQLDETPRIDPNSGNEIFTFSDAVVGKTTMPDFHEKSGPTAAFRDTDRVVVPTYSQSCKSSKISDTYYEMLPTENFDANEVKLPSDANTQESTSVTEECSEERTQHASKIQWTDDDETDIFKVETMTTTRATTFEGRTISEEGWGVTSTDVVETQTGFENFKCF